MRRRVFFSFHYEQDVRRAAQIRNIGVMDDDPVVSDNDWEEVKRGGDVAIKRWIDSNMENKSCLIVLVGEYTSERKWVDYEIEHAWNSGMGVLGIYIHRIKDPYYCKLGFSGYSKQGNNPFSKFNFNDGRGSLASVVCCYNPDVNDAYNCIADNLDQWVESAIRIRSQFK